MSENKAASRYAKSLIDLSEERNALEEIKNDMVFLEQVIDHNPELEAILKNPIVPLDKKAGILEDVFGAKVNEVTRAFFKLMVSKGRSAILFDTSKAFVAQYNALKGIVTAYVTSATELTAESRAEIIAIVKKEIGANEVVIKEKVNDKLIGGFILKVGDRQFDASIASSLSKLKKEFAQGVV
ncbi:MULTISPECIES: ATP synthase F1 subunit delta [Pedobacter]|uniref:ATP synthase subunit delta n=1 Tax=Pedobacter heparinus (strain ATCC 13125 / DSM 2366 / CIP 104194 / JCM 7457 / NBRC 12017 / NCIMB 9290 / NRRL B-14731 / HIM 762-3) TaxID=485917 RepID=C6XZS4_PEDHD|nr:MULTISPECIES: ATP synthase F1 subunit delta [Pedobacter]ACU02619.1 ATP synthase F1, delta subunit [Pedobacter heparinus DSM 2366]MBB5439890.1 F-type H+-transporting ATPase subunit delta [Pedobacter sp. AK017]